MTSFRKALGIVTVSLLIASTFSIRFSVAQEKPSKPANSTAAGRNIYNASCSGCHGLDGHGSDKAVNIAAGSEVQHLPDSQVSSIIANGVPATGMPAFRSLSPKQVGEVVRYLRALQGKGETQALAGDARHGKEIFFGKGECSSCHTISGQGGFLGPDLSEYASTASAKAIHEEIVRARRNPGAGYRSAILTTADGQRLEGVIRNEDNFSVQFQSKDGNFHFFQRSQLAKFDRLETSLMPTNYSERLTPRDIDDLVSFLISVCPDAGKKIPSQKDFEDE